MHFAPSERSREYQQRVRRFIREHVAPVEREHWAEVAAARHGGEWREWRVPPRVEALKARAKSEGLWNLFLPDAALGAGLTTLEYAPVAEEKKDKSALRDALEVREAMTIDA